MMWTGGWIHCREGGFIVLGLRKGINCPRGGLIVREMVLRVDPLSRRWIHCPWVDKVDTMSKGGLIVRDMVSRVDSLLKRWIHCPWIEKFDTMLKGVRDMVWRVDPLSRKPWR